MNIALIGSRGIPARYSGFEQFYEQLAVRLVSRGHTVTVYNRSHFIKDVKKDYKGVRLVSLPSIPTKHLDTITHTALSTAHALFQRYDIVYYCIVGNSPLVWMPRLTGARTLINVDGEDWAREKWSGFARRYQKWCERVACRSANAVIADAKGILDRYLSLYRHQTIFVPYGANIRAASRGQSRGSILERFGLTPEEYVLYVGRFVPENAIDLLIRAYRGVDTAKRLVVVGDAPYADAYKQRVQELAAQDERVVLTGYAFDADYEDLSANAYVFVQPSGIEGTRPALLDQLGFGNAVLVRNSSVNMEVIGSNGAFFDRTNLEPSLTHMLQQLVDQPGEVRQLRERAVERIETYYNWEWITDFYERLFERLRERRPLIQYDEWLAAKQENRPEPAASAAPIAPVQSRRKALTTTLLEWTPVAVLTLLLLMLVAMRQVVGLVLPPWAAWLVGGVWGVSLFGYCVRFDVFKHIGGLASALTALVILTGSLVSFERVHQYPHVASDQLVVALESTWNALYSGNLFSKLNLKEWLISLLASLGDVDPFHGGKMLLFGVLGFILAATFLFAHAPYPGRRQINRAWSQYLWRLAGLSLAAVVFAVHVELLQALSPSRMVLLRNVWENVLGVLMGIILFQPLQFAYALLAGRVRQSGERRFNVLGVGVDAVDMLACLQQLESYLAAPRNPEPPAMACALGVAGIIAARRDPRLQCILNRSILNTPDGMPLVWLGRLRGYVDIQRVYGPDLLRDVCAYGEERGWTHYFYGAAPGVVEKLKAELEARHPAIRIVGVKCPPYRPLTAEEEAALIEEVNAVQPDIFWIGISTPKQLYLMDEFRQKLACKVICPVGYAFDVNAGVEMDAPDWVKYSGLQWLHRALKQPRLWRRYLPDNPRFVFESILQLLRLRRYPMRKGPS
jgi:exopolysaccharide biosynthesis WecB/TagA/CpsF family protein